MWTKGSVRGNFFRDLGGFLRFGFFHDRSRFVRRCFRASEYPAKHDEGQGLFEGIFQGWQVVHSFDGMRTEKLISRVIVTNTMFFVACSLSWNAEHYSRHSLFPWQYVG